MSTDRLKQRLTGGIALLVLGVIAWFWLLSADSPVDPVAQETQIPPAPAIEPFAVAEPRQPQGIDPAPPLDAGLVDEPVPVAAPVAAAPAPARPQPKPAAPAAAPVAKTAAKPTPVPVPAPAPVQESPRFEQDDKGVAVAWVVQVASLSSQAAADRLKDDLIARGYKAYTRSSGAVVRVYVGPKLSREQADADKRAIDTAFKVNSMVTRFIPGSTG